MEETGLNRYRRVYEMLEDKTSKEIYMKRICYELTGEYRYIDEMVKENTRGLRPLYSQEDIEGLKKAASKNLEQKVVIYGAGFTGKILLGMLGKERVECFCDRNPQLQSQGVEGKRVMSPEEAGERLSGKAVIVLGVWKEYQEEVRKGFLRYGYREEDLLDGIAYLHPEEKEEETYFEPGLYEFEEGEVFVDAGCLDMGTSLRLLKKCKGVKKIYAFEPDGASYERCKERMKECGETKVKLLRYAAWSRREELRFHGYGGAASAVAKGGEERVEGAPIDEVVEEKVTFIKMDVEGAELEALKGAEETIRRWKPKLAVSIYHKPEDLLELPEYIKGLNPEYRLYLRHYKNTPGDTVLYAL